MDAFIEALRILASSPRPSPPKEEREEPRQFRLSTLSSSGGEGRGQEAVHKTFAKIETRPFTSNGIRLHL
jgi:hypothetical protein